MSPLYPFLLAVTGSGSPLPDGVFPEGAPLGIRWLQTGCWLGIVVLLGLAGRRLLGGWWSVLPALLFLSYRPALIYAGTPLLEIPLALCGLGFLFLTTGGGTPSRGRLAGAGLLLGAAVLLRGHALLLLIPGLAGVRAGGVSRGGVARAGVIMATAALLVMSPAIIHNSRLAGRPAGVSMNAGINLYLGNGPQATGLFATSRSLDFGKDPTGSAWLEEVTGRRARNVAEVDQAWFSAALGEIANHPGRFLRLFLRKVHLHLVAREMPNVTPLAAWPEAIPLLKVQILGYGVLAALGLAGILWRRSRHPDPAPWAVAAGAIVGVQSLFMVITRFRILLVPVLAVLAAVFLRDLVRARGRGLAAGLGALALAALAVLPWGLGPTLDRLDAAARGNLGFRLQTMAGHHAARERTGEALAMLDAAAGEFSGMLEVIQGDPAALHGLGGSLHLQAALLSGSGRHQEALAAARRLMRRLPDDPRGYEDAGLILARQGRFAEAEDIVREGLGRLAGNPRLLSLLERLGKAGTE